MGTVHFAISDMQVCHTAGDFAAYYDTAMPLFHVAVLYNDVLTRHAQPSPVIVSARFERNTIITCVKQAVFNDHTITGFRITTVGVRTMREGVDTAHTHV